MQRSATFRFVAAGILPAVSGGILPPSHKTEPAITSRPHQITRLEAGSRTAGAAKDGRRYDFSLDRAGCPDTLAAMRTGRTHTHLAA
jgi:hypothetical protein